MRESVFVYIYEYCTHTEVLMADCWAAVLTPPLLWCSVKLSNSMTIGASQALAVPDQQDKPTHVANPDEIHFKMISSGRKWLCVSLSVEIYFGGGREEGKERGREGRRKGESEGGIGRERDRSENLNRKISLPSKRIVFQSGITSNYLAALTPIEACQQLCLWRLLLRPIRKLKCCVSADQWTGHRE